MSPVRRQLGRGHFLTFTYRGLEVEGNLWLYGLILFQGILLPATLITFSVLMADIYMGLTGIVIFLGILAAFAMQYASICRVKIVVDDEKIFYVTPAGLVCIPWAAVVEFKIEANHYRLQAYDGRSIYFTTRLVGYTELVRFIQGKVDMWKRNVDVQTGLQAIKHTVLFNLLVATWAIIVLARCPDYTAVFFLSVCLCLSAGLVREARQLKNGVIDHCFL